MAKEHLVKARELIENGWVQTEMYAEVDGKPCYCLDGAIAKAHGLEELRDNNPYRFLETDPGAIADVAVVFDAIPLEYTSFLRSKMQEDGWDKNNARMEGVWGYNDTHATSKEEVLAVLDKAIENYPDETGV
jgi:hypothetical protein